MVFGVFLLFLCLAFSLVVGVGAESVRVCVFGVDDLSSRVVLDFLKSQPGLEVEFFDVSRSDLRKSMADALELLQISGVKILPPDVCLTCVQRGRPLDEVLVEFSSPTVGFFRGGVLTAVSVGVADGKLLSEALFFSAGGMVRAFTYSGSFDVKDADVGRRLGALLVGGSGVFGLGAEASGLLLPLTFLAVADSVNPCTFMVFTALLLVTLQSLGRARALATGLCYIYAIFLGYYVLGVLGISFLGVFQGVDKLLAVVGLAFGGFAVLNGLTGRSPLPERLRVFLGERLSRGSSSLVASFALGLFCAFTLLPCSSEPYVVGMGLLSVVKDAGQAYALLAFYNLVFVLPLVVILVTVSISGRMVREVKFFRSRLKSSGVVLDVLGGAALVGICVYILLS